MCESVNADQLAKWFSAERIARYETHPHPELLYVWSTQLSKAFLEDIQHVEVLLRNTVDTALRSPIQDGGYGSCWFLESSIPFTGPARNSVQKARKRTRQGDIVQNPGKIIAELSFDFWYFLFTPTYTATIWPKFLRHIPAQVAREEFRHELEKVYVLRNRCAHHEPLVKADITAEAAALDDYSAALKTVSHWIDPQASEWIERQSRVSDIRSRRP